MSNVQVFDSPEFGQVRVNDQNGQEWYCASDVCRACGIINSRDAVSRLDDDEKTRVSGIPTPSGQQEMTFVSEAGLYALVLTSNKPEAKSFKRWITHEVIPSIRKHGAYMTDDALEKALTSPDFLIRLATELKTEKERRITAEQQIESDKPKVLFCDAVATSKTDILIGELAKILRQNGKDIGQNRLFECLRNEGYLCRTGSSYNMPTQKAMDLGLFRVKETPIVHSDGHISVNKTPKVTGKGQVYFVDKFLNKGVGVRG